MSAADDDYRRGHLAGGIAERLDSHDRHFAAINGSLEKIFSELHATRLAMQRMADQSVADAATVITTAAALEKAEAARRERGDQRWSPVARLATVFGALAAVAGAVAAIAWYLSQR
jgi:hypothetical protein